MIELIFNTSTLPVYCLSTLGGNKWIYLFVCLFIYLGLFSSKHNNNFSNSFTLLLHKLKISSLWWVGFTRENYSII